MAPKGIRHLWWNSYKPRLRLRAPGGTFPCSVHWKDVRVTLSHFTGRAPWRALYHLVLYIGPLKSNFACFIWLLKAYYMRNGNICTLFLQTPTLVHPETGLVWKGSPSPTPLSWEITGHSASSFPRIRSSRPVRRPTAEPYTLSPMPTTRPLVAPWRLLLQPCGPFC